MNDQLISLVWALIFLASLLSVELGLSVAIIEISLGVIGGNFLGLQPTPWITYLAGFGGILLTFLAGAEVDTQVINPSSKRAFLLGAFPLRPLSRGHVLRLLCPRLELAGIQDCRHRPCPPLPWPWSTRSWWKPV